MKTLMGLILVFATTAFGATDDLAARTPYSATGRYQNNPSLHTTLYVGVAKSLSGDAFVNRLAAHVDLVKQNLDDRGLVSYTVYATSDHEVAVMQWTSEAAMTQAFEEVGGAVRADGEEFLSPKLWETMSSLPNYPDENFFENILLALPAQ